MHEAEIKRALKENKVVLGSFVSEIWAPTIAWMYATAGFDFMFIDMEHGSFNMETAASMILASRAVGIAPVVRAPSNDRPSLMRPLDAGAAGLLVPMVETRAYAEQVVRYAKYPPTGQRGLALRRAHSYYRALQAGPYLRRANDETLIIAQIETQTSVDNLNEILSVGGIDVAFIGPADLSTSMGYPGQASHPEVIAAIERVMEISKRYGVSPGIHVTDVESAGDWAKRGMRFISYSGDVGFIVDTASKDLARIRAKIQP
ncbi:MAG: hypothetical protein HY695_38220 [Deltaproteobacteria bacterium]|nr:hypothetical protein [Deltaproteobacteria bacterium]